MYPHLDLQLIFTLILLTLPAYHTSTITDQFSTCSNLYNCGESIRGVGYPFWGDHRPQICGLQGFELTCGQENNFPTIDMNTQTFYVLSIQESSHQMTLAHLDVDGKLCKQGSLYNTDLNNALFAYNHDDVGFVNVYYNCPSDINTKTSSYSEVKQCNDNGLMTNSILTLDVVPGLERCTFNITVPVLNSAILELKNNISMELGSVNKGTMPHLMRLKDVFKQGFSVDYKIDEAYCSACKNSSGLCWSGTDEAQKTCLCKDGANASVCTTPNKGKFFYFSLIC